MHIRSRNRKTKIRNFLYRINVFDYQYNFDDPNLRVGKLFLGRKQKHLVSLKFDEKIKKEIEK